MTILAWFLTYAIHSTLFLGAAYVLTRLRPFDATAREVVWKAALIGGLVTATLQSGVEFTPVRWELANDGAVSASAAPATPVTQTFWLYEPVDSETAATPIVPATRGSAVLQKQLSGGVSWVGGGLAVWALLALAVAGRRAVQRRRFVASMGERRVVEEPRVRALVAELERASGARGVRVTTSSGLSSPVALGDDEICLPRRVFERFEEPELRALIAHELAHLVRRDPQWLVAVTAIESLFFFQPLNRMAAREVRSAAEEACDAQAVAWTGEGQALARCLLEVAQWIRGPIPASVAGMSDHRSGFEARVRRLVTPASPATDVVTRRHAAGVVGALALAIACGGPSVQSGTRDADPAPVLERDEEEVVDPSPYVAVPRPEVDPEPGFDVTVPAPPVEPDAEGRVRSRKRVWVSPDSDFAMSFRIPEGMGKVDEALEKLESVFEDLEIDFEHPGEGFAFDVHLPDGDFLKGLTEFPGFVRVRIEGEVEIENGAIVSMGEESRVEIVDERGDVEKRIVVEPDARGEPIYAYTEDGEPRPFDAGAREWLRDLLSRRPYTGHGEYMAFDMDFDGDHAAVIRKHRDEIRENLQSLRGNKELLRKQLEHMEREVERLRERLRDLEDDEAS